MTGKKTLVKKPATGAIKIANCLETNEVVMWINGRITILAPPVARELADTLRMAADRCWTEKGE